MNGNCKKYRPILWSDKRIGDRDEILKIKMMSIKFSKKNSIIQFKKKVKLNKIVIILVFDLILIAKYSPVIIN